MDGILSFNSPNDTQTLTSSQVQSMINTSLSSYPTQSTVISLINNRVVSRTEIEGMVNSAINSNTWPKTKNVTVTGNNSASVDYPTGASSALIIAATLDRGTLSNVSFPLPITTSVTYLYFYDRPGETNSDMWTCTVQQSGNQVKVSLYSTAYRGIVQLSIEFRP